MGKKKLKKYAGAKKLHNILQPDVVDFQDVLLKNQWDQNYFNNDNEIVVELGCGKGEYTIALAKEYPEKNFIGIDIKSDRMFLGAQRAIEENLENVCFVRLRIEFLSSYFPPDIFSEGWITFPDPYESSTNGKKRLTSERFLNIYRDLFKKQSCIYLKTDSRVLYDFSHESLSENKTNIISYSDDLYNTEGSDSILTKIKTTYEKRYLNQLIKIKYIKFSF